MTPIDYFWSWLTTALNFVLNLLNRIFSNSVLTPFFKLLIVVFAFGIIFKFVIIPVFGSGASDKAGKKKKSSKGGDEQ